MPNILDEVEQLLQEAASHPNPVSKAVATVEKVASDVIDVGTAAITRGAAPAAVAHAEAAAGALKELVKFSNAVGALNAVILAFQVKHWLKDIVSRLPKPLGKNLPHLIDMMVLPEEQFIQNLASRLSDSSKTVMHSHVQLTGWALQQDPLFQHLIRDAFPVISHPTPASFPINEKQAITNLDADIKAVNRRIDKINYALGIVQQHEGVPRHIADEIRELQKLQHYQTNAIVQLKNDIERVQDTTESLQNQLNNLRHELGGLRQVRTGWQDIVEQVQKLSVSVTGLGHATTQQLHHQERQITQLLPLGLLLQPGIQGLRTLRQLEDTPCMCPKLPNIPDAWGVALGVMEFIENG